MRLSPIFAALGVVVLAGCGVQHPQPAPWMVQLNSKRMAVHLSNGEVCRVPMGGPETLQGQITDCSRQFDYAIDLKYRNALDQLASDVVEPFADITIRSDTGREWVFKTPQSRNDKDWFAERWGFDL